MYPFGGIILPMMLYTLAAILMASAQECVDQASWCRKLGSKRVALSRCYKEKNEKRCCASCRRLKLSIPGCPYGDKQGWCSSIGKDTPASDCYVQNQTCCETCHLFDSGIPSCPFGDGGSWCSQIGGFYTASSCYDHASYCCTTCMQYRRNDPNCMFGDRQVWCAMADCSTKSGYNSCCETCKKLAAMTPPANGTAGITGGIETSTGRAESKIHFPSTADRTVPAQNDHSTQSSTLNSALVSTLTTKTYSAPSSTVTIPPSHRYQPTSAQSSTVNQTSFSRGSRSTTPYSRPNTTEDVTSQTTTSLPSQYGIPTSSAQPSENSSELQLPVNSTNSPLNSTISDIYRHDEKGGEINIAESSAEHDRNKGYLGNSAPGSASFCYIVLIGMFRVVLYLLMTMT